MNSPYKSEILIDTPLVCITQYTVNKKVRYGLSIRYYAGEKTHGDHQVFADGKMRDNQTFTSISFNEFVAVVHIADFDFDLYTHDLEYYLFNYKVPKE